MEAKEKIERKLDDVLHELKLRTRDGSLTQIQRMYGVALGIRIALMQFGGYEDGKIILSLLSNNFGQMKLREIREYTFPEEING